MAITRQLANGQKLTDWTDEVNDIANQYGVINGSGMFSGQGTSLTSMVFDKEYNTISLIPQSKRNGGPASKGNDRKVDTFTLAIPYFLHQDYITPQDIQGQRQAGTPDSPETLANVTAKKLEDMRLRADQTREFMKLQAVKAVTSDGEGNVIADMFSLFDVDYGITGNTGGTVSQLNWDFDLGNPAANINGTIAAMRRSIAKNAKVGGRTGAVQCMVSTKFFDDLVNHPKIREAYLQFAETNANSNVIRGDLQKLEEWGVVDTFQYKGVLFYTYDAEFLVDDGAGGYNTRIAIGETTATSRDNHASYDATLTASVADGVASVGYTVVEGMRGLYQGHFGPENTLTGANSVGSEIMVRQYTDPKEKFHEMELEMANLYHMTRPQMSVRVYSAT
tara:strand:- start:1209 stop:2384 length:1176 start_codon:yes stop_codon:yes gene_type:complete